MTKSTHSVIVPIYNAPLEVQNCLTSLKQSLNFAKVELILIDDASEEITKKLVHDFSLNNPTVRYICHEKNQGYLSSVNEGLGLAKGDVITLLNSDTTIPKLFSERILACFNHKENIGVASPILAKGIPFSVPLPKHLTPLEVDKMDELIKDNPPLYPTIVFPDGACFSISKTCREKVGFFDLCYKKGYFEELDFSMRAVEEGFDTVLIDNLYVYHRSHASFDQKSTLELMKKNKQIFMEKWSEKYTVLHQTYPKLEHKKRIYTKFYSKFTYYFTSTILKLAKIIPVSKIRRQIRQKYQ